MPVLNRDHHYVSSASSTQLMMQVNHKPAISGSRVLLEKHTLSKGAFELASIELIEEETVISAVDPQTLRDSIVESPTDIVMAANIVNQLH